MAQASESFILDLIDNEHNFERIFFEKKNHLNTMQLDPMKYRLEILRLSTIPQRQIKFLLVNFIK
ncbi:hypothetical protein ALQ60_200257 [Pseudomonas syringae pv. papulans]|nr:hypothetical protein AL059_26990 [Pseudomonas syringae pv. papulans]RMN47134.1 hypothetical protein ALQ60_200257 [Pseudomonas syringae pv. papulans]RMV55096.1 hypothetical protein ALP11_01852 [Pseudomonas syringae pv. papulans]